MGCLGRHPLNSKKTYMNVYEEMRPGMLSQRLASLLPSQLRPLAWRHPKDIYALLFECAVSTLQKFARNAPSLSGELGLTAVLHTHTRRLDYHPHLHVIIPGGCLLRRRRQWKKCKGKFLFNEMALGKVFRGRFLSALQNAGFTYPATTPKAWVVHCQHVGHGLPSLQYLSRYLYRGVISEHNILSDDGVQVTFRYTDGRSGETKMRTLAGEDFLWLLLQHTLPKGFRRVRDYGFLHGNAKKQLHSIQLCLRVVTPCPTDTARPPFKCCRCHQPLVIVGFSAPVCRSG